MLLVPVFGTVARAYCVNPSGNAGDTMYNRDWRVEQYCNSFQWMPMGRPLYTPQGVTFDGSTNYLSDTTTLGAADGSSMTGSFWFRRSGNFETSEVFLVSSAGVGNVRSQMYLGTDDKLHIDGGATSSNDLLVMHGSTAITDSNWHHFMFSFDLSNAAHRFMYLDGVAETITAGTYTNGNIVFSAADTNIGASISTANKFQGDLADVWLDEDYYLDLSQAANRAYFIDSTLNPVYLGTDGSMGPTGAAPTVFLSGAVSAWQTNNGSGGGFTLHGTLTDADPITTGDIATALAGWWPLDDGSGTSAVDFSGNGDTGTLVNTPTWTTGQDSGALTFNGTNQNVTVPDVAALQLSGSWTVSTWVNFSALPTSGSFYALLTKGAGSYLNYTLRLSNISGVQTWGVLFSESAEYYQGAFAQLPVSTGTWYLITGVWDSSTNNLYLYVNGALLAAPNTGANIPATGSGYPLAIGTGLSGNYLAGSLDDVRVYSRALSAADVRKLYNVGYYTCTNPSDHRGDLVYNGGTHHVLQYCDGATWRAAGPNPGTGGGGCSSPAGSEGHIIYNGDHNVMQYCDGAVWRQIGGIPPTPPASGLVGYWKFDAGSGGSAVDSSGNSNTGTLVNSPTWTTSGKDSDALTFGTNKYVDGSDAASLDLSGDWTVSAWTDLTAFPPSAQNSNLLQRYTGSPSYQNYAIFMMGSGTAFTGCGNAWTLFYRDSSGTYYHICAPTVATLNAWSLVTGTYVSSTKTLSLYINGALVTSAVQTAAPAYTPSGGEFYIGGDGTNNFFGTIDEVRIYNTALSAQQIRDLYNGT